MENFKIYFKIYRKTEKPDGHSEIAVNHKK
jgi:hypothetical protein